jgi:hypothetical protein
LGYTTTAANADLDTLPQAVPSRPGVSALPDYLANNATVNVYDYGVAGDGTADDTDALQSALDAGNTQHRVVCAGNAVCKITSGLTMSGPGLVFDRCAYGSAGDPGIHVSGTGYTALTVSAGDLVSHFCVMIAGTGNAANGLYLNNPVLARYGQIRVYNLAGFGCKIDKCYDCLFDTISVELCGTTSAYAFSMNDAGDTCNATTVNRLQVEQATAQAIYISDSTLDCHFGTIHSERLSPNASYTAWNFGGASTYSMIRLSSNGTSSNAKAKFTGDCATWTGIRAEGSIDCQFAGINGAPVTIVSPNIAGTAHEQTNQTGKLTFVGGKIASWTGNTSNRTLYNTVVG